MSKVLSTKLAVDEIDRFNSAAEQRGLSKSGLLKHLVEEYLGGSDEENKSSDNSKPGNSSSSEERQTQEKLNREFPLLKKQKVLRNGELEKCFSQMHQTGKIKNGTQHASIEKPPMCSSSTATNSQLIASLARALDSKEAITRGPTVEQGLLKVEAKTQSKPKIGFGGVLLLGLGALWIASAWKNSSNQKILPEPNYSGYPDFNEDIAVAYRDMGIPYNL
jgi:hypothetical protein